MVCKDYYASKSDCTFFTYESYTCKVLFIVGLLLLTNYTHSANNSTEVAKNIHASGSNSWTIIWWLSLISHHGILFVYLSWFLMKILLEFMAITSSFVRIGGNVSVFCLCGSLLLFSDQWMQHGAEFNNIDGIFDSCITEVKTYILYKFFICRDEIQSTLPKSNSLGLKKKLWHRQNSTYMYVW